MFLQVSVILSTGGGMRGCLGGRAWLLWGGVHGCSRGVHGYSGGVCGYSGGACVVALGGHAWLLGGVCGYSWGVCMVAWGACVVTSGVCAWLLQRGVHGCLGGHAWLLGGVCVVFLMRYGQWAGDTHPTGMHSCFSLNTFVLNINWNVWKKCSFHVFEMFTLGNPTIFSSTCVYDVQH